MYEVHKKPNQFHEILNRLVKEDKITESQKHEIFKEANREYYSTLRVRLK